MLVAFAVFDKINTTLDAIKSKLSEAKSAVYCRLTERISPLIMGPSVCPTSIVVLKKPIDVPAKPLGTSSKMSAEVDEITIEKPNP